MSELFREAFRTYSALQARRTLDELGEYAAGRNPKGYTEADVPGSSKKCVPGSRAAGCGLTGDCRHRHQRLDFRALYPMVPGRFNTEFSISGRDTLL